MRRQRLALASSVVATLALLAGCAPQRDVAWYRAHGAARARTLAACRNNMARQASAPCANALRADAEAMSQAAWTVEAPRSRLKNPGKL
jgi:hypothetical protein